MESRFDLLVVNRQEGLLILGSLTALLLATMLLIKYLLPVNDLLSAALPWLLTGLAFASAYWLLTHWALKPVTVILHPTELLVQRGAGQPRRLPLADIHQCRYIAARGAHTLLLYIPAGRLRLATSELLAGTAQGARFAEMAGSITQAVAGYPATPRIGSSSSLDA